MSDELKHQVASPDTSGEIVDSYLLISGSQKDRANGNGHGGKHLGIELQVSEQAAWASLDPDDANAWTEAFMPQYATLEVLEENLRVVRGNGSSL